MSLILRALPFKQRNVNMYLATVPVGLLDHFSIALWNPKSPLGRRGYQRELDDSRVTKIATYFERRDSIMPVAGLLNVRQRGDLRYRKGKLTIPDGVNVWVVDMQHRMKGLIEAKEGGLIRGNFPFPIVITEGLGHIDEAAQFYIINTKAKKMKVALTRRLLIENDRVRDVADVRPWEIAAVKVAILLNQELTENPWFERLQQPNEERLQRHIAPETSFVSSLRPLLIGKKTGHPRRIAKRIARFWAAIRINIEEPFREPRRYLIQKTPGMFAFNFFIAPAILARYRDKDFVRALAGLEDLGAKFWRRTNKRGARRFGTGMAGYSNLADYIKKHL